MAGLIARTLGPAGRPAVIKDPAGGDIEAPDAETIAACFTPDHPRAGLGASYVRDLVRDQHAMVPDGAATAVVLAGAMVRQAVAAVDGGADPTGLARGSRPRGTWWPANSPGARRPAGRGLRQGRQGRRHHRRARRTAIDILPVLQAAVTNATALTVRVLTG
jgi:hypothetical protein